ncbi:hypothetical protein [Tenacibaculum aiptasiae]|nr:hypothetical protein [Tenacibaculum aiptasiae]
MTPIEFKKLWMNNSSENWVEFPIDQIKKSKKVIFELTHNHK